MTDVATPTKEYKELAALWTLPRTLMGGTRAMRKAGVTYLPKEAAESSDAYAARLARTTLFNAFRKTVRDMTGKVFRKKIVLEKDVPSELVAFAENIDNAGRHLNVFARDVFFDAMQPGIAFILVEMPKALAQGSGTGRGGEVTRADEQKRRPYFVHIKAEDLIGWKTAVIEGVTTLVQARILECVTVADGPYAEVSIKQIRVLEPGRWEIHREVTDGPDKGKWIKFDEGNTTLGYIPLVPVYLNRTGFMTGEPPLEDLADLNVAHWQSQSDQRNILHVARVPVLFMSGFTEDDTVEIGASKAVRAAAPDADMKYVEHTGAAIDAGDKDISNLEFQMQTQGLQLLVAQPGGKTATGEMHDEEKENSPLAMMATALEDAIELGFAYMADYISKGQAGGSVVVNKDFGITAGAAAQIPNIINAVNAGILDKQTAIEMFIRYGLLPDDADAETIQARADAEMLDSQSGKPMNLNAPGGAAA